MTFFQFQKQNIPLELKEQTLLGGLRMQIETQDKISIYRPKGFLFHHFEEKLANCFHSEDLLMCVGLMTYASTEKIGGPGHLFERLIATELTIPISPLYKKIFAALNVGEFMSPDPFVSLQPVKYHSQIYSIPNLNHTVHCVKDDQAMHDRWVDVGVPVEPSQNIYIECKTGEELSTLWRDCYTFFSRDFGTANGSPRVFLSLVKFSDYTPNNRQTHSGEMNAKECCEKARDYLRKSTFFAILEGEEVFANCFFPISRKVLKEMNHTDFYFAKGEAMRTILDNSLSQFVKSKRQKITE